MTPHIDAHADPLALVATFCTAMEQPVSQGWNDTTLLKLGGALVHEEAQELHEALAQFLAGDHSPERQAHIVKELCDVLYVAYWLSARVGIDITEAFRRVHVSNMSKLGDDGKPCTSTSGTSTSGKVQKGPHYSPPDLTDIVTHIPITL